MGPGQRVERGPAAGAWLAAQAKTVVAQELPASQTPELSLEDFPDSPREMGVRRVEEHIDRERTVLGYTWGGTKCFSDSPLLHAGVLQ